MDSRPCKTDFKPVEKVGLSSWSMVPLALLISLTLGCATPPEPQSLDWSLYGNDYANTRYSHLGQLNTENVANLKVAWTFDLDNLEAQECTPLVVDGTLFVTTASGPKHVYALDAKTGSLKWKRDFEMPEDFRRYACCGIVKRGPSYADGKLLVGRLDGYLTALDAHSGEEVWSVQVVDYQQGSVITSPPLVVGNKVITGYGGGEYGGRGSITAYDLNSGTELWKTWTIPGEGEPGNDSWKGDTWKTGGGAAWFIGSYDPHLNLIYWGTGNPSPWKAAVRGPDSSDYGKITNLYSASTLALDATTGEIRWHYQTTPYDAWDYDGVNELVLADLNIDGKQVPALMKADRNGFFYVLNRQTGALLSAEKFVPVNWAERIDLETGLPVENPEFRATTGHRVQNVHPGFLGGKNWQPMAYNPNTGLVYIPANNLAMDMETGEVIYQRGLFYLGSEWEMRAGPGDNMAELVAWNPVSQEKVWSASQRFPLHGGTATTAGNLVFMGGLDGLFSAYDATTGERLWSYTAVSGINAAPMTYLLDDKQYIALTVGRPTVIPAFIGGDLGKAVVDATPAGGMVVAFSLPE